MGLLSSDLNLSEHTHNLMYQFSSVSILEARGRQPCEQSGGRDRKKHVLVQIIVEISYPEIPSMSSLM